MARRLPGLRVFLVLIPILLLLAAASLQPGQAGAEPLAQKDTPHAVAGREDCLACHGAAIEPVPPDHAGRGNATCLACHKAAAAKPAAPAATPGAAATPAPAARPPASPSAPSLIPHTLEGRAACTTCHGPAGRHPFPKDHFGRTDGGCDSCHVPISSPRAAATGQRPAMTLDNAACLNCHRNPDLSMTLKSGQKLDLTIDEDVYGRSVHGSKNLPCTSCHAQSTMYPHPPVTATVVRELDRGIVQQACASCHTAQFTAYKDSVHGAALLNGNLDVPSCIDCHGAHDIRDPETALFRNESTDTCSKCHADAKMMAKYNISANVTQTYLNDFHGASVRLTKEQNPSITSYKAVCYDCHGIHDIKAVTDPNSSVLKANLVQTCQKCHADASTNFPSAWMGHFEPNREKWPLVYLVNLFYKIFIPVVVLGMVGYIGLDIAHNFANKAKGRRKE